MIYRSFFLVLVAVSQSAAAPAATLSKPMKKPTFTVNTYVQKETKKERAISTTVAVKSGLILALNSGFLNGCCLSGAAAHDGTKQAVAAVTGAYTTAAVGLATGRNNVFATQMKVLASYIGGSFIASLMNPTPKTFQLSKSVGPAFVLAAALLFSSKSMFSGNKPLLGFCLAAIVNGMQNSITSVHTANLCRTAHFSGCSSDIGTFLGQVVRGNKANQMKLQVFVGLTLSFFTGGYLSVLAANKLAESSLLLSAVFYLIIGLGLMLQG